MRNGYKLEGKFAQWIAETVALALPESFRCRIMQAPAAKANTPNDAGSGIATIEKVLLTEDIVGGPMGLDDGVCEEEHSSIIARH